MFGSFVFVSPAAGAPVYDLSQDTLSVWLRDEGITGDLATLNWAGRASAGSSATHNFESYPAYDDEVTVQSAALDTYDSVLWPPSGNYPRLTSGFLVKELLGAVDDVAHSYTVAMVVRPLAANSGDTSGGRVTGANPSLFDGLGGYFSIPLLDIGGDPHVGVYHYDVGLGAEGTVPVAWPGGWGEYGLLWVAYDHSTSTVTIRINGAVAHTSALNPTRGAVALGGVAGMGATGGGSYELAMEVAELVVWPGVALTGAAAESRETYFADRYASLPL